MSLFLFNQVFHRSVDVWRALHSHPAPSEHPDLHVIHCSGQHTGCSHSVDLIGFVRSVALPFVHVAAGENNTVLFGHFSNDTSFMKLCLPYLTVISIALSSY